VSDERLDAVPLTASGHHLGAIVRGARTAQRMTLAELGRRTGYSAAQVSRYERGIAPLTDIDVIIRFARALGIPPGDFGLAAVAADGDVPGILASVTSRGCRVRVLLLNPDSPGTRSIDHDEGNPPGTIAARTRAALARFTQMRITCGNRMQIRVYDEYPTVSVVRGDDTMLVTPYLRFFIGSNSPTFEIRTPGAPKMSARYVRHFESTWHLAEDWTP
jgi:transcriptional regulator with XRE-family HTH domain